MRVAFTMRIVDVGPHGEQRDSISHDWLKRVAAWGMDPLLVPNVLHDPERYLAGLAPDLIVFTGGEDLGVTTERDITERALLKAALTSRRPVLGICRGMQLINDFFGGRLAAVQDHVACTHAVKMTSEWRSFYGDAAEVNSFHNWSVPADGVGQDLHATAWDCDGQVEALCHGTFPLAAVMWHPERGSENFGDRALFERIASQAAPK